MIIGITGTLGAGKGTVVEILKKRGFKHYSVRGLLTEEIKKRNMPLNRDSMVFVGNDLREKNSPSYIAEKLYEIAKKNGGDSVIESLRTLGEIGALRKKGNFYLFSVDAGIYTRYERITGRKLESDFVSFEKFKEDEEREMTSTDPNKQNLSACIKLADYRFYNNGTIGELERNVEEVLKEIKKS